MQKGNNLGSNYMIFMNLSWMLASSTNLENKEKIGNNKNDKYLKMTNMRTYLSRNKLAFAHR